MKDWKGNEIKSGDTVVIVTVKSMFGRASYGYIIFKEDGTTDHIKVQEGIEPPKYMWNIFDEKEIFDMDGHLRYYYNAGDIVYNLPAEEDWLNSQSNFRIVCIKGVSDNKHDYYTSIGVDIDAYEKEYAEYKEKFYAE